jgi:hypothetical protein
MNSRGGACSPADSDVDDILFGTARFYIFDARALDDFYFYFYSSFSSSYLFESASGSSTQLALPYDPLAF